MKVKKFKMFFFLVLLVSIPYVLANTYVADIGFITSQILYTTNERMELKGNLYLSNYSSNGTLLTNHTGLENTSVVISIINKDTNVTDASYALNSSTDGEFYSRSNYYSTATLISAPATAADYYIKVNYSDPNGGEVAAVVVIVLLLLLKV